MVATNVSEPIVAIQEVALGAVPIASEPIATITTGEGIVTILSPPVMMPATATPPHSTTTSLVSSHKSKHLILILILTLSLMYYISGVGSLWIRTTFIHLSH